MTVRRIVMANYLKGGNPLGTRLNGAAAQDGHY
jgi:hypothetical protein